MRSELETSLARAQETVVRSNVTLPAGLSRQQLKSMGYLTTYTNPAYGELEICVPWLPWERSGNTSEDTADYPACRKAQELSRTAALRDRRREATQPLVFVSAYDNAAVNLFEFHWHSGTLFNVSAYFISPPFVKPRQDHLVVVPHYGFSITAEFIFDDTDDAPPVGIAWNGLWGAEGGVQALVGDTPRDRAEVWFDRA